MNSKLHGKMPRNEAAARLDVTMLQAGDGDAIFIRCLGDFPFNILIDGGRGPIRKTLRAYLDSLPAGERQIDLFVVTHIDADHIMGAIEILSDPEFDALIRDVWFNYPGHFTGGAAFALSFEQGNELVGLLKRRAASWNRHFDHGPAIYVPGTTTVELTKESFLQVLAPSEEAIAALFARWEDYDKGKAEEEKGDLPEGAIEMGGPDQPDVVALNDERYAGDPSIFNRSSISFLLTHRRARVLISGDNISSSILAALKPSDIERALDCVTLPHHGSKKNVSHDFVQSIRSRCWLVSTDGSRHGHPSPQAIARLLVSTKNGEEEARIVFNHRHAAASVWDDDELKEEFNYSTEYPDGVLPWKTVSF